MDEKKLVRRRKTEVFTSSIEIEDDSRLSDFVDVIRVAFENNESFFSGAEVHYGGSYRLDFEKRLNSLSSMSEFLSDKLLLSKIASRGLPYTFFELVLGYSALSRDDWFPLLEISPKTLSRYRLSGQTFKASQSERILEITEIMEKGKEYFKSMENFSEWLEIRNFGLGNVTPKSLLDTSFGRELVRTTLTNMQEGIFV